MAFSTIPARQTQLTQQIQEAGVVRQRLEGAGDAGQDARTLHGSNGQLQRPQRGGVIAQPGMELGFSEMAGHGPTLAGITGQRQGKSAITTQGRHVRLSVTRNSIRLE